MALQPGLEEGALIWVTAWVRSMGGRVGVRAGFLRDRVFNWTQC